MEFVKSVTITLILQTLTCAVQAIFNKVTIQKREVGQ